MTLLLSHIDPVLLLLAGIFVDIFAVALVIPLLPFYAKALGATPSAYGLLSTTYGVFQLIGYVESSVVLWSFVCALCCPMCTSMATILDVTHAPARCSAPVKLSFAP